MEDKNPKNIPLINWLALTALALVLIPACSLLPQAAGDRDSATYDPALISESFQYEGVDRTALFYIPYPLHSEGVPVVFVLHGAGGTAERMMQKTTEGRWNELAFQEKFIVVYPQGWNRRWNDCRSDISEPLTSQDDVGFLMFLLDWLAEAEIPSRPYFTPIHLQPFYQQRFGYAVEQLPVTTRLGEESLALPFSSVMTEEQVDYVCNRLLQKLGQR